jgi:hypothetical protein
MYLRPPRPLRPFRKEEIEKKKKKVEQKCLRAKGRERYMTSEEEAEASAGRGGRRKVYF